MKALDIICDFLTHNANSFYTQHACEISSLSNTKKLIERSPIISKRTRQHTLAILFMSKIFRIAILRNKDAVHAYFAYTAQWYVSVLSLHKKLALVKDDQKFVADPVD